jgi:hypothetical protein
VIVLEHCNGRAWIVVCLAFVATKWGLSVFVRGCCVVRVVVLTIWSQGWGRVSISSDIA